MNLLSHSIAQRAVNPLMTGDTTGAIELSGNDSGKEMPTVAFDLQMLASKPLGDEMLNVGSGRIGHLEIIYDIELRGAVEWGSLQFERLVDQWGCEGRRPNRPVISKTALL